jgi:hypothetical protein
VKDELNSGRLGYILSSARLIVVINMVERIIDIIFMNWHLVSCIPNFSFGSILLRRANQQNHNPSFNLLSFFLTGAIRLVIICDWLTNSQTLLIFCLLSIIPFTSHNGKLATYDVSYVKKNARMLNTDVTLIK